MGICPKITRRNSETLQHMDKHVNDKQVVLPAQLFLCLFLVFWNTVQEISMSPFKWGLEELGKFYMSACNVSKLGVPDIMALTYITKNIQKLGHACVGQVQKYQNDIGVKGITFPNLIHLLCRIADRVKDAGPHTRSEAHVCPTYRQQAGRS